MNQNLGVQSTTGQTSRRITYGLGCAYELTKWIIVFIIIATLIHFFVVTVAIVEGISMEPNFHTGQYLIVNRWDYNFGSPKRGDAVVLKFPGDPEHKKYIKRIIALPGEHIQIGEGKVFVNGKHLIESYIPESTLTESNLKVDEVVKKDEYFIMGDNRPNSNDSRIWSTAGRRFLIGRAWIVVAPKIELIKRPQY